MPERGFMTGQRGSVLVGVIAMSAVMTVAAGGFLFVAANSGGNEQADAEDQTLHYAAESAMYLGAKWVRGHSKTYHASTEDETLVLTLPETDYAVVDGIKVRVVIQPDTGVNSRRILETTAIAPSGKDTLVLKWTLDSVGADVTKCIPYLSNWQESYKPGSP